MADLLKMAILGTGQVPTEEAALTGTAVDALVAQLSELTREREVLLEAGGLALLRRAAAQRATTPPVLVPAPLETQSVASPALALLIRSMLEGEQSAVLEETCVAMAQAGLRLPEELLPLALSRVQKRHREPLRLVLGERGRWLSRHRAGWSWVGERSNEDTIPDDAMERWELGSASERLQLLRVARATARDQAQQWLTANWKDEKVEQRLAWLEVLEAQLSELDTELLQRARNDRSAQVRVAAARLLWRLPESEVAKTVRKRADQLLDFRTQSVGLLGKVKSSLGLMTRGELHVDLPPENYDKAWEAEGIVEAPPRGTGRRQWWLAQLLAAVPPCHWVSRFSCSPAALVSALVTGEFAEAVLDGWSSAALRFKASDWVVPLWDAWAARKERGMLVEAPLRALTPMLAPEEAELRFARILREGTELDLLDVCPVPWPPSVTRAFLAGLAHATTAWTPMLAVAALALPRDVLGDIPAAPAVLPIQDYAHNQLNDAMERFEAVIDLRRRVAQEIAP